ncbi:hypothetical protein NW133_04680 [Staphylococcus pettenkoferi]|uniref:Uncharacterized protein n=1 Tax=Staphylococcus pettenkoferi TaxID=170573 RepID=A0ABT4BM37_9STAP|nr:hypothetical protein [Staphylococcus pettenkoferi]MCY1571002.1 hypothetical protein [Staphylococcus pettenkoferi]MCY1582835.1 hypothetical protein [Staphylococcus pettenkoferi]MCY1607301.1 hypothetical protein [Staphylococcus pettenkoferi]MDH9616972.1 hypothetical protein [Staphylococcus pettenkoferi]
MGHILLWIFIIIVVGKIAFSFIYGLIDGSKNPQKYHNFLSKEEQRRQEHREKRKRNK